MVTIVQPYGILVHIDDRRMVWSEFNDYQGILSTIDEAWLWCALTINGAYHYRLTGHG